MRKSKILKSKSVKKIKGGDAAISAFLSELKTAADDVDACTNLTVKFRLTAKHMRNMDEPHRQAVARAYGMYRHVSEAGTEVEVVAKLRKLHPSIKSNNLVAALLNAFIEYGPSGRQYVARDKANVLYLELVGETPATAADRIKKDHGLVACAAEYRKMKRNGTVPKCENVVALKDEVVPGDDEMVLAAIILKDGTPTIANHWKLVEMGKLADRKDFYAAMKAFFRSNQD